jgi:serine/threonine-protein kinase
MTTKRPTIPDWTGQTLFGKWTAERLIGVGGTSTVLQARHRNGRRAALKILHPHLAAHGRTRDRFLREGRLANLVEHRGVVAVLDDFVTDDGTAVLVLELVRGKTLAALAKESGGVLTAADVVTAAREVLEVLAVAHDANVIHRDIKPENVLRCPDGSFKLADFGLAALSHELGMLTGTNAALGTPAYMSPEQARGNTFDVDARTDIWGLGATMFTLLTGRFLHASAAPKNLVVAAATEQAPEMLSIDPVMHPGLAKIMDRALRMNKEERWPNARTMLAELQAIDVPASEGRSLGSVFLDQGTTLSTAPSFKSASHATTWRDRVGTRPRTKLIGAVALVGFVALGAILARQRVSSSATTMDTASDSRSLDGTRPAGARVAVSPTGEQAPASPAPLAAPSSLPSAGVEKAALSANVRAVRKAHAQPPPSSTPRVPSAGTEPDPTIPDEVLDRRE